MIVFTVIADKPGLMSKYILPLIFAFYKRFAVPMGPVYKVA